MKKISAEVRVAHCSLIEKWVAVVPDDVADELARDPQALLDFKGDLDITNDQVDNEEERDVNADLFDVTPYEFADEVPTKIAFLEAVISERASALFRAQSDLELSVEQFVKAYVQHKVPDVTLIRLEGETVFTGETYELRVHIAAIERRGDTTVADVDVQEIDDVCEGVLMYLSSDDYYGEYELEV